MIGYLSLLRENVESLQRGAVWLTLLGLIKVLDEPGVRAYLLNGVALLWVRVQDLLDQVATRLRYIVRNTVVAI